MVVSVTPIWNQLFYQNWSCVASDLYYKLHIYLVSLHTFEFVHLAIQQMVEFCALVVQDVAGTAAIVW